jgi:hypothetical protein
VPCLNISTRAVWNLYGKLQQVCLETILKEFCYDVSDVPERYGRYLRFYLITTVNFSYVINKLIILIPDPH